MTRLAILGAGRVSTVLAAKLAANGHIVTIGVRDPSRTKDNWKGPELRICAMAEAVEDADVVVNALPGDTSLNVLSGLSGHLSGRILVDVANATKRGPDGMPAGLLYPDTSLAEELQRALPQTRVVKTLNTMLSTIMAAPDALAQTPTVFLSGDDATAKQTVRALLLDLGWADDWIVNLGPLASARGTEAFVLIVPFVLKAKGFAPFALTMAR
ncbi:NADP oxidoreductase [Rhizobium lusitanum]|uniref:NADP oxidoreductase n=1 Tax=Rhizobium lusitanum TaxID=293958 RepID=A0A6L9UHB4_9HYPH|nr:NAD(P)-binding domain-containing protein [Rhizobium lusitanum]NEI73506.1 NADP oxidoreductase [Rhizobium lusitanum]